MSYPFTNGLCVNLQSSLSNVARNNTSILTRQQTGMLDSLISPENTRGFQQLDISNANGGTRAIELVFIRPATSNAVHTTKSNICTPSNRTQTPNSQIIDPANLISRYTAPLVLSEEEMSKLCLYSTDEYRAQVIMGEMNALNVAINQVIAAQVAGLAGQRYGGANAGAPITVNAPLHKASDNSVNMPGWINTVQRDLKNIRVTERPIVVGAGGGTVPGIYSFTELLNIGCCNEAGIDLSRANNRMAFFYDQDIDVIVGNNQFIVYVPGSMQLIRYAEYAGISNPRRKIVENVYEHSTIVDPFTGIEYDFRLNYDNCTESWQMSIGLSFMLWSLPINQYSNEAVVPPNTPVPPPPGPQYPIGSPPGVPFADPMRGVNNILRYIAVTI